MTPDTGRSAPSPGPERLLGVYLNDHRAGAAGGVALLRRMVRTHRGTPAGARLVPLLRDVEEDRDSLLEVMEAFDVPVMHVKSLVVRLAEKAARTKPNGRLIARSPLSDLLELEAIRLGVEGKLALWRSLANVARTDSRVDRAAMHRLAARAERQIALLEGLRLAAVDRTFTPGGRPVPAAA
ncbi:hypothetical protein ACIQUQ_20225 [Streptomyces sp. NPDC101118]|uniref:hypothetical protein n=1 Tax=Streptomyces sp. NPDC101118 TaxID=3366109 RepID=UPI00381EC4A4